MHQRQEKSQICNSAKQPYSTESSEQLTTNSLVELTVEGSTML